MEKYRCEYPGVRTLGFRQLFPAAGKRPTPRDEYLEQVRLLNEARQRRPELMVFTLDYWNPEDAAGIRRIYRAERANGFQAGRLVALTRSQEIILRSIDAGLVKACSE